MNLGPYPLFYLSVGSMVGLTSRLICKGTDINHLAAEGIAFVMYRTSFKDDWEMIFMKYLVFSFPCISQCIRCN